MTTDAMVVDVSQDWVAACDLQERFMQPPRAKIVVPERKSAETGQDIPLVGCATYPRLSGFLREQCVCQLGGVRKNLYILFLSRFLKLNVLERRVGRIYPAGNQPSVK